MYALILVQALLLPSDVQAQGGIGTGQQCVGTCQNDEEPIPDNNCVLQKLFDPTFQCCELKCPEDESAVQASQVEELINIFGNTIFVPSARRFGVVANMALISVMTGLTAFAFIFGTITAGYRRTQATTEEEIIAVNKTLVRIIVGFILAWSVVIIVNLVTTLFGLGSVADLTVVDEDSDPEITISYVFE